MRRLNLWDVRDHHDPTVTVRVTCSPEAVELVRGGVIIIVTDMEMEMWPDEQETFDGIALEYYRAAKRRLREKVRDASRAP